MGIDIYMRWDDQTENEREEQYTGFSPAHGHVGYLREAYHGGPYATKVLLPETWYDEEARIPAATLRERLPEAIEAARERARVVYEMEDDPEMVASLEAFVALAERLESEGRNPYIVNSY